MSALTAGTSRSLNLCWKSWVENISMLYQAWGLTSLEVFDDLAFQWSDTQVQRNQASGSLFRISYCCVWGQITWGGRTPVLGILLNVCYDFSTAELQFDLSNCSDRGTVMGQFRLLCSKSRAIWDFPVFTYWPWGFFVEKQLARNSFL